MTIDDPSHGPASVDGRGLYCERVGTGPALVLIHSAFLDSRMWDPQVEVFGRGRTIVRYDVRGRGRSTGERQGGSDAEDLEQLLDGLGITRAVILGNSDGARIACEFAARALPRVVGLVLVAGNPPDLDPTPEEENRFMDGFAATEGALLDLARSDRREEAIEKILDIWAPQVLASDREALRVITRDNCERFLAELTRAPTTDSALTPPVAATLEQGRTPILSISGAHDNPGLNMMMGRFAQRVPSARHVELAAGDHSPSFSARRPFEQLVLEFLEIVEAGRPWPPPA